MDDKIKIELTITDGKAIILGIQDSRLPSREANRICDIFGGAIQSKLTIEKKPAPKKKTRKK